MEFHETSSRMGTIKLLPIIPRYQYRNAKHRKSLTLKIIYCKKYYFRRNSRKVLCKHCDNLLEISASKVCLLSQVLEILFRVLCNKKLCNIYDSRLEKFPESSRWMSRSIELLAA